MALKRKLIQRLPRWRVRLYFTYTTDIEVDAESMEMAFAKADAVYKEGGHDETFFAYDKATAKEIP